MILEGAHGPVSPHADKILERREIPVVPDILANGGGTVVSYFEWIQNRTGYAWMEEVVAARHEVRAEGDGPLAQLLDLVLVGDLVSWHLAQENEIDPGPVAVRDRVASA